MKCTKCGTWALSDGPFCPNCGTALVRLAGNAEAERPSDVVPDGAIGDSASRAFKWALAGFVAVGIILVISVTQAEAPPESEETYGTTEVASPAPAATNTTKSPGDAASLPVAPRVGALAPDFSLLTLEGRHVSLTDYRGGPLVVNFWATWCPPCRQEIPLLQQVFQQRKEVPLVTVDTRETPGKVREFLEAAGYSLLVALDENGTVSDTYQIRYIPTTLFIDGEGVIRSIHIGSFTDKSEIDAEIAKIVRPAAPTP